MKYCVPFKEGVGIYYILNLVNGKKYIGQTSEGFYNRFKRHEYYLNNGNHYNEHLQASYNKYGANNFEFRIIKKCLLNRLDLEEVKYIYLYKTFLDSDEGYNLNEGGSSVRENYKRKYYRIHSNKNGNTTYKVFRNGDYSIPLVECENKLEADKIVSKLNKGELEEYDLDNNVEYELWTLTQRGKKYYACHGLISKNRLFMTQDKDKAETLVYQLNKGFINEEECKKIVTFPYENVLHVTDAGYLVYNNEVLYKGNYADFLYELLFFDVISCDFVKRVNRYGELVKRYYDLWEGKELFEEFVDNTFLIRGNKKHFTVYKGLDRIDYLPENLKGVVI